MSELKPPFKGRPARIKYSLWKDNALHEMQEEARFHCWGSRPAKKPRESDTLPKLLNGMETVGICELRDGRVILARPERIQFLDREENAPRVEG